MFRRDPVKVALDHISGVLDADARPLLALTRAVFRRGGVLAVSRAGRRVIAPLGGVAAGGVFELASVSKPFTAALAGELVRAGRLTWDTPLLSLGGPFRRLPAHLTPLSLSTHTAGLPMHPARAAVTVFTRFHDPYGGMSAVDVIASARRWARPMSAPRFAYSNLGAGLLALALAGAAGRDVSAEGFGHALTDWVTGPLGLDVTLRPPGGLVRPSGLLGGGTVTGFGPLAGAGGLFGTAADLLGFGEAALLAPGHSLLAPPILHPAGLPAHLSGVTPGWLVSNGATGDPLRWHDGLARGTRAGLGLNPSSGAVVALLVRGTASPLGVRAGVPLLLLSLLGGGGPVEKGDPGREQQGTRNCSDSRTSGTVSDAWARRSSIAAIPCSLLLAPLG